MKRLACLAAALLPALVACQAPHHGAPPPEAPGQTVFIDSSLSLSDVQQIIDGVDSWSRVSNVHPSIVLRDHDEMANVVTSGPVPPGEVYVFGKNGVHGQCPRVGDANWRNPHAGFDGLVYLGMTLTFDHAGAVMCLTVDAPPGSITGGLAGLTAHEFGHALHLQHAPSHAAVMFSDVSVKAELPTCDDARDLAALDEGYEAADACE